MSASNRARLALRAKRTTTSTSRTHRDASVVCSLHPQVSIYPLESLSDWNVPLTNDPPPLRTLLLHLPNRLLRHHERRPHVDRNHPVERLDGKILDRHIRSSHTSVLHRRWTNETANDQLISSVLLSPLPSPPSLHFTFSLASFQAGLTLKTTSTLPNFSTAALNSATTASWSLTSPATVSRSSGFLPLGWASRQSCSEMSSSA